MAVADRAGPPVATHTQSTSPHEVAFVADTTLTPSLTRIEGILPSSRAGRPRSRTYRKQQKMPTQGKSPYLAIPLPERRPGLFDEGLQIETIRIVFGVMGDAEELFRANVALAVRYFLDAAHFKPLPVLNGLDEVTGL